MVGKMFNPGLTYVQVHHNWMKSILQVDTLYWNSIKSGVYIPEQKKVNRLRWKV